MTIVNKHERTNSRWRFWIGYILSLLVVSLTVYFTLGAAKSSARSEETELERLRSRNDYWEKMANVTTNIDQFRALSLKAGDKDNYEITNLEVLINEDIGSIKGELNKQIAAMEYPDKVLRGLANYFAFTKSYKDDVKKASDDNEKKLKLEHKEEMTSLKNEHKADIQELKTKIQILEMNSN